MYFWQMKLRIKKNTLRLRLSIDEMQKLADGFSVEMNTCFGETTLKTVVFPFGNDISASFLKGEIIVVFPQQEATVLLKNEDSGVEHNAVLAEGKQLKILIEKDFKCIGRADELNAGLFPNPKEKNK